MQMLSVSQSGLHYSLTIIIDNDGDTMTGTAEVHDIVGGMIPMNEVLSIYGSVVPTFRSWGLPVEASHLAWDADAVVLYAARACTVEEVSLYQQTLDEDQLEDLSAR